MKRYDLFLACYQTVRSITLRSYESRKIAFNGDSAIGLHAYLERDLLFRIYSFRKGFLKEKCFMNNENYSRNRHEYLFSKLNFAVERIYRRLVNFYFQTQQSSAINNYMFEPTNIRYFVIAMNNVHLKWHRYTYE